MHLRRRHKYPDFRELATLRGVSKDRESWPDPCESSTSNGELQLSFALGFGDRGCSTISRGGERTSPRASGNRCRPARPSLRNCWPMLLARTTAIPRACATVADWRDGLTPLSSSSFSNESCSRVVRRGTACEGSCEGGWQTAWLFELSDDDTQVLARSKQQLRTGATASRRKRIDGSQACPRVSTCCRDR